MVANHVHEGGVKTLRMKELRQLKRQARTSEQFQYFHVGRKPDCQEIRPSKFDVNGKMPEPAVFVTTAEHIMGWAAYIRDGSSATLYLYGVTVPEQARIEEGLDGAQLGDYKVITSVPLKATFIKTM